MKRKWFQRVEIWGAILGLVVGANAAGADTAPGIDRGRLVDLVRQDCGSCHGLTLKGGLGRPLTPEAIAHFDRDSLRLIILDGIPGTPMPPWRPLLSEAEAATIADILKSGEVR